MKQSILRVLSLVLILTLLATSGAMAFEFKDVSALSDTERKTYRDKWVKELESRLYPSSELAQIVPIIEEIKLVEKEPGSGYYYYAIPLTPLKGFEDFKSYPDCNENIPGFDVVKIYTSDTKNGEYTELNINRYVSIEDGMAYFYCAEEKAPYVKIQYGVSVKLTYNRDFWGYSKLSAPVKAPYVDIPVYPTPKAIISDLCKISSSEAFIMFEKTGGEYRVLQIREKGSKKWTSVSKSKLVKSYKATQIGYTLNLDTSKEYELRARIYRVVEGKKYYSDYVYTEGYLELENNAEIKFLRYDYGKDDYAIQLNTQIPSTSYGEAIYGYQLAYRKAGSSKWNYKYISSEVRYIPAKYGYEYKIRPYENMGGKKVKALKWSKVKKCTNKTSAYVNEATLRDTTADHLIFDHSKTYDQNYDALAERFWDLYHLRIWDDGLAPNYEDWGNTGKIDRSRENEGYVGVHAFGGGRSEALLDMFCLYAEDNEVAYALRAWVMAYSVYGTANSDFFGFRDVKKTENGFIMEMNGQQIEVEWVDRGGIFWFNMND